ncbi:MAG: response regulator [Planctomycetota bacterium]
MGIVSAIYTRSDEDPNAPPAIHAGESQGTTCFYRQGAHEMKFMLVDDSSTMRKIQRRTLEKLGFSDIIEADDGAKGLEIFGTTGPDIVITDWNMPNMTGLEMVTAIRSSNKTTPIIMVTTEAEKTKVVEAIKAGISDYLIKPFTPEALSAKIRKVTGT